MTVHFVGFRGEEYVRAQKVWRPDFIHVHWDSRAISMVEEMGGTVIFANSQTPNYVVPHTFDDSKHW